VRAGNLGVSFVGTLVGGLVARGAGISVPVSLWLLLVMAGLSTALVTGGGNVLNDLLDLEGDRTNHPDRPLVTGEVSVGGARGLAVALFVLGVVVAVPVAVEEPLVGVILVVAVALLLAYEFRFKKAGFAGNLVVAFLTGVVFLYGGAAAGNAVVLLPFAAMAFLATLSREVIKDMEDVAGTSVGPPCPNGTASELRQPRRAGPWRGAWSSASFPSPGSSISLRGSGLSTSFWSGPPTRSSGCRSGTSPTVCTTSKP